jgi:hypothetical protein
MTDRNLIAALVEPLRAMASWRDYLTPDVRRLLADQYRNLADEISGEVDHRSNGHAGLN